MVQKNTDANESMEAQSRRSNLIIYGIKGDKKESWETSELKFRQYLSDELEIDALKIRTERVYRLKTRSSPAPIIVKFSFFKDRDVILKTYRQKRKDVRESASAEGRDTENTEQLDEPLRFSEDFPVRIRNGRKKLMQFLRKYLSEGKNAYIKYDKLVIDNEIYQ